MLNSVFYRIGLFDDLAYGFSPPFEINIVFYLHFHRQLRTSMREQFNQVHLFLYTTFTKFTKKGVVSPKDFFLII